MWDPWAREGDEHLAGALHDRNRKAYKRALNHRMKYHGSRNLDESVGPKLDDVRRFAQEARKQVGRWVPGKIVEAGGCSV